jgi:hypothetical protein
MRTALLIATDPYLDTTYSELRTPRQDVRGDCR